LTHQKKKYNKSLGHPDVNVLKPFSLPVTLRQVTPVFVLCKFLQHSLISTLKVSITNLTFRERGRLTDTVLLKGKTYHNLSMSKHKHQAKVKILAKNKH
jgi:hypothetical protein